MSRQFWVFAFWMIFSVFQKNWVLGILGPPYCGIGATIRIGREMLCLPYAGFSKNRPLADSFIESRCPSVCLRVCPFSCCTFWGLFAPTFRSRMSNIFRDSESLRKSNGKKWSHIWIFLLGSDLKLPRKKKFVFWLILSNKTWWKPRFPMD